MNFKMKEQNAPRTLEIVKRKNLKKTEQTNAKCRLWNGVRKHCQ